MNNMSDIVGKFAFPFQTEIHFLWTIYTTAKNLSISARGHIGQKQYRSACLCVLLLLAYVGLAAAVVWVVVPWLKAILLAKFALSPFWFSPVKRVLLWGIGKMVAPICRKLSLKN
ncbi:abortive infection protein [Lelliottia sp.]|uniref:abortive infection protein n=1 Tax=Lelliottia sp. TaxID=1898429 RepID=UPI00388D24B2